MPKTRSTMVRRGREQEIQSPRASQAQSCDPCADKSITVTIHIYGLFSKHTMPKTSSTMVRRQQEQEIQSPRASQDQSGDPCASKSKRTSTKPSTCVLSLPCQRQAGQWCAGGESRRSSPPGQSSSIKQTVGGNAGSSKTQTYTAKDARKDQHANLNLCFPSAPCQRREERWCVEGESRRSSLPEPGRPARLQQCWAGSWTCRRGGGTAPQ